MPVTRASSAGTPATPARMPIVSPALSSVLQPLAGEHAAGVVVGSHDGGLAGPVGKVVVDQHDLDAGLDRLVQRGLDLRAGGGDRDALHALRDHDSMMAIWPSWSSPPCPDRMSSTSGCRRAQSLAASSIVKKKSTGNFVIRPSLIVAGAEPTPALPRSAQRRSGLQPSGVVVAAPAHAVPWRPRPRSSGCRSLIARPSPLVSSGAAGAVL